MEQQYQKFLTRDEKIIRVMEISGFELMFSNILTLIFCTIVAYFFKFEFYVTAFAALFFISVVFGNIYRKISYKYLVTDKRVIVKKGLIGQSAVSADYQKISDITVEQGVFERLFFGTGSITLDTAGTDYSNITLDSIEHPFEAKNVIYEQLDKATK